MCTDHHLARTRNRAHRRTSVSSLFARHTRLTIFSSYQLWKLKDTPEARSQVEKIKDLPSSGRIVCEMGDNKIVGDARSQGYNWGMYSVWNSYDELHTYAVSKEHVE